MLSHLPRHDSSAQHKAAAPSLVLTVFIRVGGMDFVPCKVPYNDMFSLKWKKKVGDRMILVLFFGNCKQSKIHTNSS